MLAKPSNFLRVGPVSAPTTVVTPGNHDGVHRGHRRLIEAARELAGGAHRVTALTFDPHPARVLAPSRAPELLTQIERRVELLKRAGCDDVEVLRFDRDLAAKTPEEFVNGVLLDRLSARGVVVGPDFRFGKGRAGDVSVLRSLGERLGYEVRSVGPVEHEGEVVSSTRIRAAVRDGDVAMATALLARVHEVAGEVVKGHQRGRTIGFPTANLAPEPVLMPADGVYAVIARVDGELVRGVANLGVRPTMEAGRSAEVHLFDFDRDIYGATMRVGFVARLRGEEKFDGLDALKAQIARDASDARAQLEAADAGTWSWI